jgi:hypothetical protein
MGLLRSACAPLSLGLAAAFVLLAWPVRAKPEPYELSYTAPPGCPAETEIVAEVRANVHDAASGEGPRIALTIVENGTAFVGELVAFDRSGKQGRRTIEGPTCSDVGKTLAFLAALAIELGGRVEAEPAAAAPVAEAPAVQVNPPKPAKPSGRPSAPIPRDTWKLSVLLGAGLRGALAPSLRPSGEAGLDFGHPAARVLAPAIRATLVGSLSRISRRDGTAKLSFLAGRLAGCPLRFGSRAVALRPCLGFELGAVFASGELDGGRSVVKRWGSSEASLRLETWLAPQVFLEIEGAALVSFFRTHYFFVPDRIIYAVPALAGRAAIVTGFRFQ